MPTTPVPLRPHPASSKAIPGTLPLPGAHAHICSDARVANSKANSVGEMKAGGVVEPRFVNAFLPLEIIHAPRADSR